MSSGGRIEGRGSEIEKEREPSSFLPACLPAFHFPLAAIGDWVLDPTEKTFKI